jgi:hypothetical protein
MLAALPKRSMWLDSAAADNAAAPRRSIKRVVRSLRCKVMEALELETKSIGLMRFFSNLKEYNTALCL